MRYSRQLVEIKAADEYGGNEATTILEEATDMLDGSCLELCISLLNHDL